MRALIFDRAAPDTGSTRVGDLAVGEPGPAQVSIDVAYAGINFKDVMARRGDVGYVDAWPFVPGLEVAGTVRASGSGVTGLAVGDEVAAVTGAGGLAEVAIADAALTVPVPPGVGLEYAAAAPGALVTAALLLDDVGRLRPGETVLLHGAAGGVGQAVARLARASGAGRVLGTVGSAGRIENAQRFGYDQVLVRGPGLEAAVAEASNGHGVDLILDPQGTALVDVDLDLAAPGARIVLFGNASGAPLAPLPPLARLFRGNIAIAGFSLAAMAAQDPGRVGGALSGVLTRLAAGTLAFDIDVVPGLHRAATAQQALADGHVTVKQVVAVTPSRR